MLSLLNRTTGLYIHILLQVPLTKYKNWFIFGTAFTIPLHFWFLTLNRTDFADLIRFQKSSVWVSAESLLFYIISIFPVVQAAFIMAKYKNPVIRFHFWIQFIVISFLIFRTISICLEAFSSVFITHMHLEFISMTFSGVIEVGICSIALSISGLYVFVESPYFKNEEILPKESEKVLSVSKKFSLKEEDFLSIKSKIEAALLSNEVLGQNDLNEQNFSELLQIPKHQISIVINNHYQCGFKELLNSRRIDLVISLKKSGKFDNYSLFGLAQHCGYKAESTFIANFKKRTGKLPSEYFANQNTF